MPSDSAENLCPREVVIDDVGVRYTIDLQSVSVSAQDQSVCEAVCESWIESQLAESETEFEDGLVRVLRWEGAERPTASEGVTLGPVYRSASGQPAVPTGRVFVRFDEAVNAQGKATLIEDAEFLIDEIPGYAQHSCWVIHRNGMAGALREFTKLSSISDVLSVEPQFLLPVSRRDFG